MRLTAPAVVATAIGMLASVSVALHGGARNPLLNSYASPKTLTFSAKPPASTPSKPPLWKSPASTNPPGSNPFVFSSGGNGLAPSAKTPGSSSFVFSPGPPNKPSQHSRDEVMSEAGNAQTYANAGSYTHAGARIHDVEMTDAQPVHEVHLHDVHMIETRGLEEVHRLAARSSADDPYSIAAAQKDVHDWSESFKDPRLDRIIESGTWLRWSREQRGGRDFPPVGAQPPPQPTPQPRPAPRRRPKPQPKPVVEEHAKSNGSSSGSGGKRKTKGKQPVEVAPSSQRTPERQPKPQPSPKPQPPPPEPELQPKPVPKPPRFRALASLGGPVQSANVDAVPKHIPKKPRTSSQRTLHSPRVKRGIIETRPSGKAPANVRLDHLMDDLAGHELPQAQGKQRRLLEDRSGRFREHVLAAAETRGQPSTPKAKPAVFEPQPEPEPKPEPKAPARKRPVLPNSKHEPLALPKLEFKRKQLRPAQGAPRRKRPARPLPTPVANLTRNTLERRMEPHEVPPPTTQASKSKTAARKRPATAKSKTPKPKAQKDDSMWDIVKQQDRMTAPLETKTGPAAKRQRTARPSKKTKAVLAASSSAPSGLSGLGDVPSASSALPPFVTTPPGPTSGLHPTLGTSGHFDDFELPPGFTPPGSPLALLQHHGHTGFTPPRSPPTLVQQHGHTGFTPTGSPSALDPMLDTAGHFGHFQHHELPGLAGRPHSVSSPALLQHYGFPGLTPPHSPGLLDTSFDHFNHQPGFADLDGHFPWDSPPASSQLSPQLSPGTLGRFGEIFGDLEHSLHAPHATQHTPGQLTPGQLMPGQHMPGQHMPGQHIPGQHIPGQHPFGSTGAHALPTDLHPWDPEPLSPSTLEAAKHFVGNDDVEFSGGHAIPTDLHDWGFHANSPTSLIPTRHPSPARGAGVPGSSSGPPQPIDIHDWAIHTAPMAPFMPTRHASPVGGAGAAGSPSAQHMPSDAHAWATQPVSPESRYSPGHSQHGEAPEVGTDVHAVHEEAHGSPGSPGSPETSGRDSPGHDQHRSRFALDSSSPVDINNPSDAELLAFQAVPPTEREKYPRMLKAIELKFRGILRKKEEEESRKRLAPKRDTHQKKTREGSPSLTPRDLTGRDLPHGSSPNPHVLGTDAARDFTGHDPNGAAPVTSHLAGWHAWARRPVSDAAVAAQRDSPEFQAMYNELRRLIVDPGNQDHHRNLHAKRDTHRLERRTEPDQSPPSSPTSKPPAPEMAEASNPYNNYYSLANQPHINGPPPEPTHIAMDAPEHVKYLWAGKPGGPGPPGASMKVLESRMAGNQDQPSNSGTGSTGSNNYNPLSESPNSIPSPGWLGTAQASPAQRLSASSSKTKQQKQPVRDDGLSLSLAPPSPASSPSGAPLTPMVPLGEPDSASSNANVRQGRARAKLKPVRPTLHTAETGSRLNAQWPSYHMQAQAFRPWPGPMFLGSPHESAQGSTHGFDPRMTMLSPAAHLGPGSQPLASFPNQPGGDGAQLRPLPSQIQPLRGPLTLGNQGLGHRAALQASMDAELRRILQEGTTPLPGRVPGANTQQLRPFPEQLQPSPGTAASTTMPGAMGSPNDIAFVQNRLHQLQHASLQQQFQQRQRHVYLASPSQLAQMHAAQQHGQLVLSPGSGAPGHQNTQHLLYPSPRTPGSSPRVPVPVPRMPDAQNAATLFYHNQLQLLQQLQMHAQPRPPLGSPSQATRPSPTALENAKRPSSTSPEQARKKRKTAVDAAGPSGTAAEGPGVNSNAANPETTRPEIVTLNSNPERDTSNRNVQFHDFMGLGRASSSSSSSPKPHPGGRLAKRDVDGLERRSQPEKRLPPPGWLGRPQSPESLPHSGVMGSGSVHSSNMPKKVEPSSSSYNDFYNLTPTQKLADRPAPKPDHIDPNWRRTGKKMEVYPIRAKVVPTTRQKAQPRPHKPKSTNRRGPYEKSGNSVSPSQSSQSSTLSSGRWDPMHKTTVPSPEPVQPAVKPAKPVLGKSLSGYMKEFEGLLHGPTTSTKSGTKGHGFGHLKRRANRLVRNAVVKNRVAMMRKDADHFDTLDKMPWPVRTPSLTRQRSRLGRQQEPATVLSGSDSTVTSGEAGGAASSGLDHFGHVANGNMKADHVHARLHKRVEGPALTISHSRTDSSSSKSSSNSNEDHAPPRASHHEGSSSHRIPPPHPLTVPSPSSRNPFRQHALTAPSPARNPFSAPPTPGTEIELTHHHNTYAPPTPQTPYGSQATAQSVHDVVQLVTQRPPMPKCLKWTLWGCAAFMGVSTVGGLVTAGVKAAWWIRHGGCPPGTTCKRKRDIGSEAVPKLMARASIDKRGPGSGSSEHPEVEMIPKGSDYHASSSPSHELGGPWIEIPLANPTPSAPPYPGDSYSGQIPLSSPAAPPHAVSPHAEPETAVATAPPPKTRWQKAKPWVISGTVAGAVTAAVAFKPVYCMYHGKARICKRDIGTEAVPKLKARGQGTTGQESPAESSGSEAGMLVKAPGYRSSSTGHQMGGPVPSSSSSSSFRMQPGQAAAFNVEVPSSTTRPLPSRPASPVRPEPAGHVQIPLSTSPHSSPGRSPGRSSHGRSSPGRSPSTSTQAGEEEEAAEQPKLKWYQKAAKYAAWGLGGAGGLTIASVIGRKFYCAHHESALGGHSFCTLKKRDLVEARGLLDARGRHPTALPLVYGRARRTGKAGEIKLVPRQTCLGHCKRTVTPAHNDMPGLSAPFEHVSEKKTSDGSSVPHKKLADHDDIEAAHAPPQQQEPQPLSRWERARRFGVSAMRGVAQVGALVVTGRMMGRVRPGSDANPCARRSLCERGFEVVPR